MVVMVHLTAPPAVMDQGILLIAHITLPRVCRAALTRVLLTHIVRLIIMEWHQLITPLILPVVLCPVLDHSQFLLVNVQQGFTG